jgi:hypothetical protein
MVADTTKADGTWVECIEEDTPQGQGRRMGNGRVGSLLISKTFLLLSTTHDYTNFSSQ